MKIIFLLTIAINTIAWGQPSSDWKTISEDKFELKYPSNWELDKSGQMGTRFIIFSPLSGVSDNFKENINLLIQDLAAFDLNLEQYVRISEEQIKIMITEGNIILSERQRVNKEEYHKIIYTGKQGILSLKFEQYYWVMKDQAFVLTLTCKEDEFDNYKVIGEDILNSFEIK